MKTFFKTLMAAMLLAFVVVSCDKDDESLNRLILNKNEINFNGKTGVDTLYTKDKKSMRINMVRITRLENPKILLDTAAYQNKGGDILSDGKKIGEYTCSSNTCIDDIWVYDAFRISRNKDGKGILRYSYKIEKFKEGNQFVVELSAISKHDFSSVSVTL